MYVVLLLHLLLLLLRRCFVLLNLFLKKYPPTISLDSLCPWLRHWTVRKFPRSVKSKKLFCAPPQRKRRDDLGSEE